MGELAILTRMPPKLHPRLEKSATCGKSMFLGALRTFALGPFLVAAFLGAGSQPASAQRGPAPEKETITEGTLIQIETPGRQDLSGQYTVEPGGVIQFPLIGRILVLNRSPEELSEDLSRRYSLIDRSIPHVSVTLVHQREDRIYILGGVLVPGAYGFTELPTVWEAIAEAGGASDDARLSEVELIPAAGSADRTIRKIDVTGAIQAGKTDLLPRVQQGETVRVPRGPGGGGTGGPAGQVNVFGGVAHPGSLLAAQAPDLLTAVMRSGGPTPSADLTAVDIVRRSGTQVSRISVNLKNYLRDADPAGNPELRPGDSIFLQEHGRGASILSIIYGLAPLLAIVTSVAVLVRHP